MKKSYYLYLFMKGIIDVVAGLLGTIFFVIPFSLIIFLIYKVNGYKGSIFFTQDRIGLQGKKFKIIKFRSMIEDAENILRSDPILFQKYIDNGYKLPPNEDPRLTNIGNFIRKTSIDEIPQFVNVLFRQMSLIGPRPILAKELSEYNISEQEILLSVRPGITGWWQVSGRSDVQYPDRCELELYYPLNQSFWLDIKIFFLTIKKVISREGAH